MVAYITLTTFAIGAYGLKNGKIHWIALGYQQWGLTKTASEVVTYPIAVSQVYCLLLTTKATTFRYSPWPTKITTKSFQAYSDCEQAYWLLVAKQQWGKIAIGHDETVTVTLPIAVKPINVQIAVADGSNTSSTYRSLNWKSASFQISAYAWPTNYFWFAICWQQWGNSDETNRDTTVTFPIAFSVLYSVVGVPKSSSNLSGSNSSFGVKSQNNKSFIANMYDNGRGYAGFNWCAFGKAQALPIYRQQYS